MSERLFKWQKKDADAQAHAVTAWVQACLVANGPVKPTIEMLRLNAQNPPPQGTKPDQVLPLHRHWRVSGREEWDTKFRAVIAPGARATVRGNDNHGDLWRVSRDRELRVIQLGRGDSAHWLACFLEQDALHLFCPRSGYWVAKTNEASNWFDGHMSYKYHDVESETFRAWILPLKIRIHYTWAGPPDPELKKDATLGKHRTDIDGVMDMSQRLYANTNGQISDAEAEIMFHCLKQYVDVFSQLFTNHPNVKIAAIEDQLGDNGQRALELPQPDHSDIERTVAYMVKKSVELQQPQGPKRDFVNIKNIWSYYALFKYGGYHLDTGVFPEPGRLVNLPPPDTFGIAGKLEGFTDPGAPARGSRLMYVTLKTAQNEHLNALFRDSNGVFKKFIVPLPPRRLGLPSWSGSGSNKLLVERVDDEYIQGGRKVPNTDVDVWAVRAPQGHRVPLRVLQFYSRLWFLMQNLRKRADSTGFDEVSYREGCRAAIMSATYTGICPYTGPVADHDREFWGGDNDFMRKHFMKFTDKVLNVEGLRKVFHGSHRQEG